MADAKPAPSAATSPARLKKRRENARKEYDQFATMRDEAYRYAIPYRKSLKDSAAGEKRVDQAFDHTAIDAAFRFAGKLQQDLWPAEQSNFSIAPGPLVPADQREELKRQLAPISEVCGAFFDDPDWGMAFHEMAIDLAAGTGAMLMNPSDEPDKLWEPISVPTEEVLVEAGANGKPGGFYWDRKNAVRVLQEQWPDGDFGEKLSEMLAKEPEKELIVHNDCVRLKESGAWRWHLVVWVDEQPDRPIATRQSRTCPWLFPRYFRVAGETYGRGLVMLAMPTIKTVNTAARLQLQAAAIAMLGIYTAVDDGVFNPDLSPIQPGAFWKVGSNGGNRGPTVNRFAEPRLDMNQLVLQDLRQGVRSTMMDDDLPTSDEAVKSPTEIVERIKKAAANHMGAFERLVKEITIPAVKRVIELAYEKQLLGAMPNIDQLLLRVKVNSPLAVARAANRVQRNLEWLQMCIMIEQAKMTTPRLPALAQSDDILLDAAEQLGVDAKFVTSPEKRAEVDKQLAEQAQALAALQATGGKMAA
jgi:hypothetical protein